MRNRSRPPKAVRAAKGGGKDRAGNQPESQDGAPPGVRPPPPKPDRQKPDAAAAAAAPGDESSSSSRSSSSESEDDAGQGSTPPDLPPGQEMSAWSRRQVRKTTAVKSRTKPPSDSKSSPGRSRGPGRGLLPYCRAEGGSGQQPPS